MPSRWRTWSVAPLGPRRFPERSPDRAFRRLRDGDALRDRLHRAQGLVPLLGVHLLEVRFPSLPLGRGEGSPPLRVGRHLAHDAVYEFLKMIALAAECRQVM